MRRALLVLVACASLFSLRAWGAYNEPTVGAVLQSALGANVFNALTQALDTAAGLVSFTNLSADINSVLPFNGASGLLQLNSSAQIPVTPQVGVAGSAVAAAGNIGEVIASDIPQGSAVSMASTASKTVASVSLTAGDWTCAGSVATAPAGSTTTTVEIGGISPTANTLPANEFTANYPMSLGGGVAIFFPVPSAVEHLAATTTINLVGTAVFATSTLGMYGQISCRRVR